MATRVQGKVKGDDSRCLNDPVLTPRNGDGTCDCDGHKSRTYVTDPARELNRLMSSQKDLDRYSGLLEVSLSSLDHVDPGLLCRCALTDAARDPADIAEENQERRVMELFDGELSPKTMLLLMRVFGVSH